MQFQTKYLIITLAKSAHPNNEDFDKIMCEGDTVCCADNKEKTERQVSSGALGTSSGHSASTSDWTRWCRTSQTAAAILITLVVRHFVAV